MLNQNQNQNQIQIQIQTPVSTYRLDSGYSSVFMENMSNAVYPCWYADDAGPTIHINIKPNARILSIHMSGCNAVAGIQDEGLFYSSDFGVTWKPSNKTNESFVSVVIVGSNAIAGSNSETGVCLWYSRDCGQTWTESNNSKDLYSSLFMIGTNAMAASAFRFTTDSGLTWKYTKRMDILHLFTCRAVASFLGCF